MNTVSTTAWESEPDGSLALNFSIDGVTKTKYRFDVTDCSVKLYDREQDHDNDITSFEEGLQNVFEWIKKIKTTHRQLLRNNTKQPMKKYNFRQNLNKNSLRSIFTTNKDKVIDVLYKVGDEKIVFKKRGELTLSFLDFQNLYYCQKCVLESIKLLREAFQID